MHLRTLFGEIIDLALSISTEDTLTEALADVGSRHQFDHFAYLSLDGSSARTFAVSNYPAEWQAIYFGRSYMVVDPVVTIAKRVMRSFQWSVEEQRRCSTANERGFWDAAAAFGIRAGLTVPVWGSCGQVAMLTFASARNLRPNALRDCECAVAVTAVAYLHTRLGTAGGSVATRRRPGLTDREVLCLRWIAAGKSMRDVAQIAGLTYHTVRWDLDNVRAKLNVCNIKQALALAVELRLI